MIQKLSILIPAYNEEATILRLLEQVRQVKLLQDIRKELIVIDDCSGDSTGSLVREYMQDHPELDLRLLSHEKNQGKGAALHTGIARATGDFLVVQDADLEYDPEEFNILLDPVIRGYADVVYGSRFMGGSPHRILFFWHSIGNRLLTFFSNMFTNLNLTDMETCYKLVKTSLIQALELKEKRFGFEPELTSKLSRIQGIRFYEVGISYYGRTYEEGKKINWKDGFRAFWVILKYGIRRRKIILPSGAGGHPVPPAGADPENRSR